MFSARSIWRLIQKMRSATRESIHSTTQVSLVPPPCEELTTSEPSFSATRVSPPGTSFTSRAGEHEGPQVDVARRDAAARRRSGRWRARASAGRCSWPGSRVMRARNASISPLRRRRADQHAVAAGALHLLHHQLCSWSSTSSRSSGLLALPGRHVLQDRLLAEIEADHLGHVRIGRLVVGDAGADRVGERDVAGAVHRRAGPGRRAPSPAEGERVEEGVVDAAVDHVHALRAGGGAHVDVAVLHEQVARPRPAPRPSAARGRRARSRRCCAGPGVSTHDHGVAHRRAAPPRAASRAAAPG